MCPAYISKMYSNCEKKKNSFNDSKRKKEGWHYLTIKNCIIKRNNIKTSWWLLLLELSSFFRAENKLKSHEKIKIFVKL